MELLHSAFSSVVMESSDVNIATAEWQNYSQDFFKGFENLKQHNINIFECAHICISQVGQFWRPVEEASHISIRTAWLSLEQSQPELYEECLKSIFQCN